MATAVGDKLQQQEQGSEEIIIVVPSVTLLKSAVWLEEYKQTGNTSRESKFQMAEIRPFQGDWLQQSCPWRWYLQGTQDFNTPETESGGYSGL